MYLLHAPLVHSPRAPCYCFLVSPSNKGNAIEWMSSCLRFIAAFDVHITGNWHAKRNSIERNQVHFLWCFGRDQCVFSPACFCKLHTRTCSYNCANTFEFYLPVSVPCEPTANHLQCEHTFEYNSEMHEASVYTDSIVCQIGEQLVNIPWGFSLTALLLLLLL